MQQNLSLVQVPMELQKLQKVNLSVRGVVKRCDSNSHYCTNDRRKRSCSSQFPQSFSDTRTKGLVIREAALHLENIMNVDLI